jgi:3,4-dihydroxy 2-butanone 4-phosphate synthase / GTP cyclohydrolase II
MWEKTHRVFLPSVYGDFTMVVYRDHLNKEYSVVFKGNISTDQPVLLRLHSSCLTGDIFGSQRCDCGEQLHNTLRLIDTVGSGVVIYLPHEGRGIGLFSKIQAYKLQEEGIDTVQANLDLGFGEDERDFSFVETILHDMHIDKVRLITNNPLKIETLRLLDIDVVERINLHIEANQHNGFYLATKRDKMGHL